MIRALLSIVLTGLIVTVLLANIAGQPVFHTAARALFGVLCLLGIGTNTIREIVLLSAAVLLAVLIWRMPDQHHSLSQAMDLAAYFAAFIASLTALKIAAERSQSVLRVGRYLIRQPSGQRFIATATGGHVLGVMLNFAAISLMAPLIQSATKRPDGTINRALERRQMSALLRGFAWILLWAPTTLSQAVLLTLFTDIDMSKIFAIGIATSVLMMLIGLVYDRFEWRKHAPRPDTDPAMRLPIAALTRVGMICLALIGTTFALQQRLGYTTALSLMIVAPAVTLVWFICQKPNRVAGRVHLTSFWSALTDDIFGLARSAIALGLSGFIGRSLAEVLPISVLTEHLDLANVPGWIFLATLPILIAMGGQIALSPIILVVFIGQVIQTIPELPADPTHIVFALSAGWAISMFASPNATATLLISATTKIPPTQLTWRWALLHCFGRNIYGAGKPMIRLHQSKSYNRGALCELVSM